MVGNGRRKQLIWVPQPLSPPPKSENKKVQKHCKQKAFVPTSGGQMLIFQWQPITSSTWRLYFHFHLSPRTMTAYHLFHFPLSLSVSLSLSIMHCLSPRRVATYYLLPLSHPFVTAQYGQSRSIHIFFVKSISCAIFYFSPFPFSLSILCRLFRSP